jgi:curved DNA-binding protein
MQFQDYYKTLGVERGASQDEIKKAFRGLSMKYHPDRNDAAGAEDKFKEVNEAYEVLKDPEKRARYDQLGSGFHAGQDFRPPPGWQNVDFNFNFGQGGPGPGGPGGPVGFSDFFEAFFGGAGPMPGGGVGGARGRGPRRDPFRNYDPRPSKGRSTEADLTITLEDAYHGAEKNLALDRVFTDFDGGRRNEKKTYAVKIPPGTTQGTKIRLKGEGQPGLGGGAPGDLLMKVHIAPHDVFELHGHNLSARLYLTPWEAALGAKVGFETLDGEVKVTIPAGSQSGQKLRLKDKGLKKRGGARGNLELELLIRVPKELGDEERALLEKWRDLSEFKPRD